MRTTFFEHAPETQVAVASQRLARNWRAKYTRNATPHKLAPIVAKRFFYPFA